MRLSITFVLIMMLACQSQAKNSSKTANTPEKVVEVAQTIEAVIQAQNEDTKGVDNAAAVAIKSGSDTQQINVECIAEVCLQIRNHNATSKSFEIHMLNSVPVAGFQCDFPGINITGSDGGLLKENGYQTSNSASRILSFSMQSKLIPVGEGVLTTIFYSDPTEEVCMTDIVFAGIGGSKLENDMPECLKLN